MSVELMKAFEVLVIGWGGCFIVMLVLFFSIKLLLKTFKPNK